MAQKLQNKLRIGRQQGILLIMKGVIGILCIILLASTAVMIKAIGQATCPAIFNPLNAMISQMIGSIANKK